MDHYLSLFFIPVLRVKKGEPFIMCDRCQRSSPEFETPGNLPFQDNAIVCKYCGKSMNRDFKYCPFCGKQL
jgi:ribosomal protein L37E